MLRTKISIAASITICFGVLIGSNVAALADKPKTQSATGEAMPKPDRRKWESASNGELDVDNLKTKVDLPNLPDFTGHAKFIGGKVHQAQRGPNYILHFLAKEDPKLVIDWYKNTLNMYKWKINFTDAQTVTASQGGTNCYVAVNDISDRKTGDQTEIEINYFLCR